VTERETASMKVGAVRLRDAWDSNPRPFGTPPSEKGAKGKTSQPREWKDKKAPF